MPLLVYVMIGFGAVALWGSWTNLHGISNQLAANWQGLAAGLLMKMNLNGQIPFEYVYYFPAVATLSLGILLFCNFAYRAWLDRQSTVAYKPSPWVVESTPTQASATQEAKVIQFKR
jgi:hypothetical protein